MTNLLEMKEAGFQLYLEVKGMREEAQVAKHKRDLEVILRRLANLIGFEDIVEVDLGDDRGS